MLRTRFREQQADLWSFVAPGAVICVTTNASVNSKGKAVMGRGCALEAAQRYPKLPEWLALYLHTHGNRCFRFTMPPGNWTLVTFPVKWRWFDRADPTLIDTSARQLAEMADEHGWQQIVLPRPGCGNGHLAWSQVQPILAETLDERFTVVSND